MSATAVPTPNPTSAAWSAFLDSQSFNVTGLDGTPTTLSLVDIDSYVHIIVVAGVICGFCLGFVGMQIIVLVMLTDAKKIRRPIIVLNLVSLFLFEIRSLLNTIEVCSRFFNGIGETFIGAVAQYTINPYNANTLAGFIQPFLYISIIASLILQVRVVFGSERFVRKLVTIFLCFFGSVLVAFEVAYCVYTIIGNFQRAVTVNEPAWLYPVTEDLFLTFLGISSLIFLYKLAVTIRMRRRLGLKRFGPLQILFVMSAQCLVIPGSSF
jgi:pheromone alpha factor receptor